MYSSSNPPPIVSSANTKASTSDASMRSRDFGAGAAFANWKKSENEPYDRTP